MNLRPEVFHSVKLGDETQVGLPGFAFVILEKPQSPPGKTETHKSSTFYNMAAASRLRCFNIKDEHI